MVARWVPTVALVGLAAVLLIVLRPADAAAHGGLTLLQTVAGPYRVVAQVARVDDGIDELVAVSDARTAERVRTAMVVLSLTDRSGRTRGPYIARPMGGLFEARYPEPAGDSGWRVHLSIQTPQETVEAEHRFDAPAREWTWGSGVTGMMATVGAGVLVFAVPLLAAGGPRLRRRVGEGKP